jgi:hypothetical protein
MGMLILPPVKQTPQLLRDAGLVVLDIADDIRLLLCKVCNVCLEPKPCQVHNHLFRHDDRRASKRSRNGGRRRVNMIPPLRISRHPLMRSSSPSCKTLALKSTPHLPRGSSCRWCQGSWSSMGIDARRTNVRTTALPRRLSPIIVWSTIFSCRSMTALGRARCSAFSKSSGSETSGTVHISVSTTKVRSSQVTLRGSDSRSKSTLR